MHNRIKMLAILIALFGIGLAAGPLPVIPARDLSPDGHEAKEQPAIIDNTTPPEMGDIDGWGNPYGVCTQTSTQYTGYQNQNAIAKDTAGNIYVVWYDSRLTYNRLGVRKWVRATNTWDAEQILDHTTSNYVYRPSIAVDNSGNIHIVYYSSSPSPYGIWYNRFNVATQTWSGDTFLYNSGGAYLQYYPSIACTPGANNVHVVWQQRYASPTYYNVAHMEYVPASGWSTVSIVDTGVGSAYDVNVAVDASNNVYVTWDQGLSSTSYYKVWLRRRVAGVWQPIEPVSHPNLPTTTYQYASDVEVGPTGDCHITWYGYGSGSTIYRIYYRMRSSAGAWSAIDTISTDGTQSQYYPTIAVRADTAYVIWTGSTTTPYTYRELWSRTKRGTWGAPEQMTARNAVTYYPSAVADNNGEVHVAWYDAYNGNNDIWYLRRLPDVPNDVGVKSITVPGNVNGRTTTSVVAGATVKNYGLSNQGSFGVLCTLYGSGGAVRAASARTVGALAVGAETTLTFDTYNFTIFETLDVVVRTTLSGDQQPANDRANTPSILWRPQYTGGPDAAMMKWIDSDTTGGPTYAWRSIRSTGTPIAFSNYDDGYATIPIGFTFNHYGAPYTNINVYSNGYLNFGSIYSTLSNGRFPSASSPNNVIAPLWDDLHCWQLGRVNYQVYGTTPNCTLLVSYEQVRYYGAFTDSSLSFQVLLCENSGDIIFQYDSVYVNYLNYANGNSATVGIENSTGTTGLEYLYGTGAYLNGYTAMPLGNLLSGDRAIRFYHYIPAVDVALTDLRLMNYPLVTGKQDTLVCVARNFGTTAAAPFTVNYWVNGTNFGSADVGSIGVGETAVVKLWFTPTNSEVRHYFGVKHNLTGDEIALNDSTSIDDWAFPGGTYAAQGFDEPYTTVFPPTGWAAVNADLGTQNWLWYTGAGIEHTGINFTGVRYESGLLRNDDWLITSAITPSTLAADTFGFFWRCYLSSFPESLEVWAMSGQTGIADTIGLLYARNDTATAYQAVKLSLDAYDGAPIYIGFRYVSLDMYYAFVDDIWWQSNYPAVAAPTLVSPANGATGVALDGNLVWNAAANAQAYDVYLGTDNPPTILVGDDVTNLTLAYAGLTANTTYYWYVEAHNPGSSAQSTVWAFTTETGGPPPPGGWSEYAQVPVTPSGKLVKDGGWIAWDDLTQQYYVSKGYKTGDFYSFEPVTKTWTTLPTMPLGIEAKPPYKGSVGASDGNGTIYATKGNNKSGFWKYTVADSVWTQLTDVPLGLSNKKVKGGTDMVYVQDDTVGYVYLLKGYKCEFYRYNVAAMTWETLAEAPTGVKNKYDKGSWLAYDEDRNLLYAHKAKYMEMYAYDLDSMVWGAMIPGMPLINNQTTKSKKAKDGSDAVVIDGFIYTLKGGNTIDFYCYDLVGQTWSERETIPSIGTTGKKKRVKGGGSMATDGTSILALKGNKTAEVWLYNFGTAASMRPDRSGVMAEKTLVGSGFVLGPNPLASGHASLRYSLPIGGPAHVAVFDVTGRAVQNRSLVLGRTGVVDLDLRNLAAGVYLVKFSSEGFNGSQKLVVQR